MDGSRIALCVSLGDAARGLFGIARTTSYDEDFKHNFPEVWKYKPSHCFNYRYWFSRSTRGINKRIQILETVIKELENGKQTEFPMRKITLEVDLTFDNDITDDNEIIEIVYNVQQALIRQVQESSISSVNSDTCLESFSINETYTQTNINYGI